MTRPVPRCNCEVLLIGGSWVIIHVAECAVSVPVTAYRTTARSNP